MDDSPLIQAMQMRKKGPDDSAQAILDFILSHYNLVQKEAENSKIVTTQESHSPS